MIELFKEFTFESAHQLAANVVPGHPYANIHGHSFRVEVFIRGEVNPKTGWVIDFADVEQILDPIRQQLDHTYLNTIHGLEQPTLENITRWIWERVVHDLPGIHRVVVRRGTCGQGCVYEGARKILEEASYRKEPERVSQFG